MLVDVDSASRYQRFAPPPARPSRAGRPLRPRGRRGRTVGFGTCSRSLDSHARDSRLGIRDSGFGIRDSRLGIRDLGLATRDSGLATRDSGLGLGTRDSGLGLGARDSGFATRDSGLGLGLGIRGSGLGIRDSGSGLGIRGSGLGIRDSGLGIRTRDSGRRLVGRSCSWDPPGSLVAAPRIHRRHSIARTCPVRARAAPLRKYGSNRAYESHQIALSIVSIQAPVSTLARSAMAGVL